MLSVYLVCDKRLYNENYRRLPKERLRGNHGTTPLFSSARWTFLHISLYCCNMPQNDVRGQRHSLSCCMWPSGLIKGSCSTFAFIFLHLLKFRSNIYVFACIFASSCYSFSLWATCWYLIFIHFWARFFWLSTCGDEAKKQVLRVLS